MDRDRQIYSQSPMDSSPSDEFGVPSRRFGAIVPINPFVSFVAAIVGTSLTLFVASKFHATGTATDISESGISPTAIAALEPFPVEPMSVQRDRPAIAPSETVAKPHEVEPIVSQMEEQAQEIKPKNRRSRDRMVEADLMPNSDLAGNEVKQGLRSIAAEDRELKGSPDSLEAESQPSPPDFHESAKREIQPIPERQILSQNSDRLVKSNLLGVLEESGKLVMQALKNSNFKPSDRTQTLKSIPLFGDRPPDVEPKKLGATLLVQTQPENPDKGIQLDLADVVGLALQNNREIKNAYLERIVQRENLAVELDKFKPDFTPEVSFSIDRDELGSSTTNAGELGLRSIISMKIQTGGEIRAEWNGSGSAQSISGSDINENDTLRQNLQLSFNQPLLRGYGIDFNRASVKIARTTEQINILNLKSTLINTITDAILAYRDLLQALEQVKIAQSSLQRAKDLLEINTVLVEAGRLAPVELVQNESDVARQEVRLLAAKNDFESVRANLLDVLDIQRDINIIPSETLQLENRNLDVENLKNLALQNRPDYLSLLHLVEIAQLEVLQAENDKLWNLDFNASYGNLARIEEDDTSDLRAGIVLRRNLGDRTLERNYQRSRVNLLQTQNNLENLRESIEIQVTDRVRNIILLLRQVELAQKARELSEKNLENQRQLLKLGRSSVAEIVRLQEDLVQANNEELNAKIEYLNALTRLDRTVGTTLDTWQVTVETLE